MRIWRYTAVEWTWTIVDVPPGIGLKKHIIEFLLREQVIKTHLMTQVGALDIAAHFKQMIGQVLGIHLFFPIVVVREQ